MTQKKLAFRRDILDGDDVIYVQGQQYLVTDEDDKFFYTGEFASRGISKDLDYIDYIVLLTD